MNRAITAVPAQIAIISIQLPRLPTVIRYYDHFAEEYHSIRDPLNSDTWEIHYDGEMIKIDFSVASNHLKLIFKHVAADLISRLYAAGAARICRAMITSHEYIQAMVMQPDEFRALWINEVQPVQTWHFAYCLRAALHSLCNLSIGSWRPDMRPYVSQLKSPILDTYKTVRTGECFVPMAHQSILIDYLDALLKTIISNPKAAPSAELRSACILIIAHQFGCRPGQIARMKISDVRCYENGAVHISFPLLKQRGNETQRRVTRRVQREWGPLFIEYTARRLCIQVTSGTPENYFDMPPHKLSAALSDLIETLTGTRWTPTDLRHTAAQRLADAGTSHISLSEFMGHATTLTANIYFEASPTQAQRINQALALSPIYSNLAEVARTRTIDKTTLLHLPADQQVGGVPHGIPIAGIGGCSGGQSLCSKNPILSCYTCRKFLPLSDAAIHESVVESLRPVVSEFASASRFNDESPAYTQLRRMFQAALEVAKDIRLKQAESGS